MTCWVMSGAPVMACGGGFMSGRADTETLARLFAIPAFLCCWMLAGGAIIAAW